MNLVTYLGEVVPYLYAVLSLSAAALSKDRAIHGIFCSCMYFIISCLVLEQYEGRGRPARTHSINSCKYWSL